MRTTLMFVYLWFSPSAFSQHILKGVIKDEETREPLIGANAIIDSLRLGGTTDVEGKIVITNIPDGHYTIRFSYIGYKPRQLQKQFQSF